MGLQQPPPSLSSCNPPLPTPSPPSPPCHPSLLISSCTPSSIHLPLQLHPLISFPHPLLHLNLGQLAAAPSILSLIFVAGNHTSSLSSPSMTSLLSAPSSDWPKPSAALPLLLAMPVSSPR